MANALIVTGASSGLGEGIAKQLVGMLAETSTSLLVFLTARRLERLEAVRRELVATAPPSCQLVVDVHALDGCDGAAVGRYCKRLAATLEKARCQDVFAVLAAGTHERASSEEDGTWRYSVEDDFTLSERAAMQQLHVDTPLAFWSSLANLAAASQAMKASGEADTAARVTLAYISSQAVERRWWALGNSLYGPSKRAAEEALVRRWEATCTAPGAPSLLLLRYPLVNTPMAGLLYKELLRVDPQCCGPSPTFAQLLPASIAAARLLVARGDLTASEEFSPCQVDEEGIGRCAFVYCPAGEGVPATAVIQES